MADARADILASIHRAVALSEPDTWEAIPRAYTRSSSLSKPDLLVLLKDRLHDYDAQVIESSAGDVAAAIGRMLRARGVARIVIPHGLHAAILPDGFDFILDDGLSYADLNSCEGVLTQSTLAIAETGTIVLQNVPGQGRRAATLVPDYHLCLVDAADVVATVPEAIEWLRPTANLPTTFVSGPSATADIEMTRIKGVHGPRFLDVILISG